MAPNNDIFNPNENLNIPSWITEDYFRDIVAKDVPDMVAIKKFTPTAATRPGENFTSVMIRLHFDLEMKDGSILYKTYIFKTMLESDKGGDMVNQLSLFPKEMEMYSKYLPAFESLYKAAGWEIQLAPKCLLTERKENRINFLFEDLSQKNFKNLERLKGCDMDHMEHVMRKLAEFHAASAVYEEQNGTYPDDFQFGFINVKQSNEMAKLFFDVGTTSYKKAMAQWGLENAEEYIKKFPTFDQYWKCASACINTSSNSFNVLNHGDFWSSNIMFSYLANGCVNETLLVDFQICKWGSPAEDLLFFLTLSPAADIRLKQYDNFIAMYHKRLVECLKVLGYKKPIPTLRSLHQDMYNKNSSFYAFFACTNHLPIILLPSDKDSSMHNFSRNDEVGEQLRMRTYTNPTFIEVIKDVYTFYVQRGLFNFEDYD
uniref:CHK kinase-like domain-containing protein n=1 Tax=Stomoxys calcitrans TaxID=35570 RepID=A0A1I8NPT7_STOCA